MSRKKYDKMETMTIEQLAGTIDGLAIRMDGFVTRMDERFNAVDARFDTANKHVEKSIEDLAASMARGFNEQRENFKVELKELREESNSLEYRLGAKIDALRIDVSGLVYDGKKLKRRVEHLEESEFGSIQEA